MAPYRQSDQNAPRTVASTLRAPAPGQTDVLDAVAAVPDSTVVAGAMELECAAMQCELQQLREQLAASVAAKEEIQNALDLRNAALDAATSHFMIVDVRQSHRPIVYVNRALAVQHGYGCPEDLIGRSVTVIGDTAAQSEIREAMRQAQSEGHAARIETEVTRRDGTKFWGGFTTTPLRDAHGRITHYVTLGADITARRESEMKQRELQQQLVAEMRERERMTIELQLAQKLESVGRLAAGLAHEINTPIQYVGDSVHFLQSAFADLTALLAAYRAAIADSADDTCVERRLARCSLLDGACDLDFLLAEIPKAFERTREGADRVANIVRAMKEFAYPNATGHVAADLNHALDMTLSVARNEYKYAATVTTDFGQLPAVVCNVGELNQVFLNLIVNAAHAVQDSGKEVATGLITIATAVAADEVQISIADNGCGIAVENLAKIFDPFYTTKEVGRGTGQGLAIARSIVVDRHGGLLEVSSTPGVGTTFIVRLPVSGRAAGSGA